MKRHPSLAGLVALAVVLIGFLASVPAGAAYVPPPAITATLTGTGPYNLPRTGQPATLILQVTAPAAPTTGTTVRVDWPWGASSPPTVTTSSGSCAWSPVGGIGFGQVVCPLGALAAGQSVTITAAFTVTAPPRAFLWFTATAGRPDACCSTGTALRIVQP